MTTKQEEMEIRAIQERLDQLEGQRLLLEHRLDELANADSFNSEAERGPNLRKEERLRVVDGIYLGERPSATEDCIDVYRRVVASRTDQFVLRGAMPDLAGVYTGRDELDLMHLHVGLETDIQAPGAVISQCLRAILHDEGGVFGPADVTAWADIDSQSDVNIQHVHAVEAVVLRRNQVLIGGPGSGKTMFVNIIANALARRDAKHLTYWPAAMREYLPILVPLPDLVTWITDEGKEHKPGASLIWAYILHDLRERNLMFADQILLEPLEIGSFIFLFDGFDQIPSGALEVVRDSIADCANRYPNGRFLVTSRIGPYQTSAYRLDPARWSITRLAPLCTEQIDRFVGLWYSELIGDGTIADVAVEKKTRQLINLLRQPEWRESAGNPLLLTVMAMIFAQHGKLPVAQAPLYEQVIDTLMWHWEQHSLTSEANLTDLLREVGRDHNDLLMLLERLCFEICSSGKDGKASGQCGSILEETLINAFLRMHPEGHLDWAHEVAEAISQRGALVVRRQPGSFSLLHRSFAEYLAGVYLAHDADYPSQATALVGKCNTWREIIRHSVDFLVQNQREIERPLLLAEQLRPEQIPEMDLDWRRVAMSAEVLLKIGLKRVRESASGPSQLERTRTWLAVLIECGALTVEERVDAGDLLCRLGDPRFEESRARLPLYFGGEREKALGLVGVNAGSFVMGSRSNDLEADADEQGNPFHIEIDYKYWVFRYPVTVAQFQAFIDANAYGTREWWSGSGWEWRKHNNQKSPIQWEAQQLFENRPVVGVTWYEAVAYAAWLDAHLRRKSGQVPANYAVRLPTEAEWERAARGKTGRRYAWGERWNDDYANTQEKIGHITAVGAFPAGATSKGLMDMTGNVFEWCQSRYRAYPYNANNGRNDLEPTGPRVARGGSWLRDSSCGRAAFRLKCSPEQAAIDVGFRLVLARSKEEV